MCDAHRRVRRVDRLPAVPARVEHIDTDVVRGDLHIHFLCLGEHRHRRRRGVDAPLRLGLGYALHPVYAAFILQTGKRALARHTENGLLDAAQLRKVRRKHLHRKTVPFRIARIHAQKIRPKERRFLAACPRTNLQNDILFVVRVLRDEQQLERLHKLALRRSSRRKLLCRHRAQFLIRLFAQQRLQLFDLAPNRFVFLIFLYDLFQLCVFAHASAPHLLVGNHRRIRQLLGEFLVPCL